MARQSENASSQKQTPRPWPITQAPDTKHIVIFFQQCRLKWITLGPDCEYPLSWSIHLSTFYTVSKWDRQITSIQAGYPLKQYVLREVDFISYRSLWQCGFIWNRDIYCPQHLICCPTGFLDLENVCVDTKMMCLV